MDACAFVSFICLSRAIKLRGMLEAFVSDATHQGTYLAASVVEKRASERPNEKVCGELLAP
jgi:hypothetical protein